jgi:HlyD family secretion protein
VPRMTRRRKLVFGIGAAVVLLLVASTIVNKQRAKIVAVQVGEVTRQNLSSAVTASGEVRPRLFVNITSQTFGKIVTIEVAEGSLVKAGQVLLKMEAVQPAAGVAGQQAMVKSANAAVTSAEASQRTAEAEQTRAQADFARATLDWERAEQLFGRGITSQAEHDMAKSTFESARAGVAVADARVRQSAAELDRAQSQLEEARAGLSRSQDELQKTIYTSPIDGVVTSLPVHIGEQMVPGIQNSPGSYLMTVADMSEVTAEVRVDESDVLDVKIGQPAEVTVDAYPDSTFRGRVTEIGNTALLRSTGQTTTQLTTGSQEAKDFKVVIGLLNPPPGLRPGLSATARITTANRDKVLSIPIQALTMRRQADIDAAEKAAGKGKGKESKDSAGAGQAQAAATPGEAKAPAAGAATGGDPGAKKEVQGVFVFQNGRAQFRPVKTGITGVTDIEILSGLSEGDQIVTGSYKVLRDLKHLAKVRKAKGEEKKPTR